MGRVTIRALGISEAAREFGQMPAEGREAMAEARQELSERLARFAKARGRADTRQSARVAPTVRARTSGAFPSITAGPHPLLFGSEFGAGPWYGRNWEVKPRKSNGQFRVRRNGGYWFFPATVDNQPEIDAAWEQAARAIERAFGQG